MRHKYAIKGIVLARFPFAETSADFVLATRELGIIRARAQGVRGKGAKLVSALQTMGESDFIVVHGVRGWRIVGAVSEENWFARLSRPARTRAGRIISLLLRLTPGEVNEGAFYEALHEFFHTLAYTPPELHDSAECLAALRLLRALGLDAGDIPSSQEKPLIETLASVRKGRRAYIARINRGIAASGL